MGRLLDATERGRPIMEYVWSLERKLKAERADKAPFRRLSFALGALFGAAAAALVAWFMTR